MNILSKGLGIERCGEFLFENRMDREWRVSVCDDGVDLEVTGNEINISRSLYEELLEKGLKDYSSLVKNLLSERGIAESNGEVTALSNFILERNVGFEITKNTTIEELPSLSTGLKFLMEGTRNVLEEKGVGNVTDALVLSTYLKGFISTASIAFSEEIKDEFEEVFNDFLEKARGYARNEGPEEDEYLGFQNFMKEVDECVVKGLFTAEQYLEFLDSFGREFMESFIGKTLLRTKDKKGRIGGGMGNDMRMRDIYKKLNKKESENKWNKMFLESFEASIAVYNRTAEIAGSSAKVMEYLKNNDGREFTKNDPLTILDAPVGDGTVSSLVIKEAVDGGFITKKSRVVLFMRDQNTNGMESAADRLQKEWKGYGFDEDNLTIDIRKDQKGKALQTNLFRGNDMEEGIVDISYTPGLFDYVPEKWDRIIAKMIDEGIASLGEKGTHKSGQFMPHPCKEILNSFGWPLVLRDEERMTAIIDGLDILKGVEKEIVENREGEFLHYKLEKDGDTYEVVLSATPGAENTQWLVSITKNIPFSVTVPNLEGKIRKSVLGGA